MNLYQSQLSVAYMNFPLTHSTICVRLENNNYGILFLGVKSFFGFAMTSVHLVVSCSSFHISLLFMAAEQVQSLPPLEKIF